VIKLEEVESLKIRGRLRNCIEVLEEIEREYGNLKVNLTIEAKA